MELSVRPITTAEVDPFCAKMAMGFGADPHDDEKADVAELISMDRTTSAFDGDELVGTCAGFELDVTVPGGAMRMNGTTMVTVQPTHRRRGVLRAMMERHLRDTQDRREPLAGLWASESSIYGRFGYGIAAHGLQTRIDGRSLEFRGDPPPGRVTLVDRDEAADRLPAVYERVRPSRPGMLTRSATWWSTRVLVDPEYRRRGRSEKRFAVHEGPEGLDGYAIYRQEPKWEDDLPTGLNDVIELVAASPEAHEALWRFLTRIDLYPIVEYWNLPADDELPWRVTRPRRVQRRLSDGLWIRLVDIPAALTGRTYRAEGRLRLGVLDAFLPENSGTYELDVAASRGSCTTTDAAADIELPVEILGGLYLGGEQLTAPARAGLVRGDATAIETANRLFSWDPAPWCPEVF